MLRTIIAGAVTVAALAVPAPAALADDPTYGCNFIATQSDASTNGDFVGVAYGYVVHPGDTKVSIRCYVAVNGQQVGSTSGGAFGHVGLAYGDLRYSAGVTDVVTLHAQVCTSHGCFTRDYETQRAQIPPQEAFDLIATLGETLDAAVCDVTTIIGQYGLNVLGQVIVDNTGDVHVAGQLVLDC